MAAGRELTLGESWRVVVRRRWIVIACVALGVLGGIAATMVQSTVYESRAQILVERVGGGAVFDDNVSEQRDVDVTVQTEIQLLEGDGVRNRVQEALGRAEPPEPVRGRQVDGTLVVEVTASDDDPAGATALAQAYIDAYRTHRAETITAQLDVATSEMRATIAALNEQLDALGDDSAEQRISLLSRRATFEQTLNELEVDAALAANAVEVVQAPTDPDGPTQPRPLRNVALGAALGLLLGLALAFVREHLDDRIRTADDLDPGGPPALATLPRFQPDAMEPLNLNAPSSWYAEAIRTLRTTLQFARLEDPARVVLVTSANAGEGKTTVAINLAIALAQAGQTVALVDADLRHARVASLLDIPRKPGLTDVVLDPTLVVTSVVKVGNDALLDVVPAGSPIAGPSELLASWQVSSLLSDLGQRADWVIVDSAPVLPVSDGLAVAACTEAVIVVVRAGRTNRRSYRDALGRLDRIGAPVLGVVLNGADLDAEDEGSYLAYRGDLATNDAARLPRTDPGTSGTAPG